MPRISPRFITGALILAAGLVLAGALIYVGHVHFALADAGTYQWVQVDPPAGTPDGPGNLQDMGWSCSNTSTCNWAACNASNPGYVGTTCDTDTCTGTGNGDSLFAYHHSYQCQYTPPAASCTPDSSCAANTCTTTTCQATNADCSHSTITGTKNCTIPPPTCADLGETGTYPDCVAPPNPTCADLGETGTYPACTIACLVDGVLTTCKAPPPVTYPPTCADFGETGLFPECDAPVGGGGGGGGSCSNPSVTVTASPTRVKPGFPTTLMITGTGVNTSCIVTDDKGAAVGTANASSCTMNGSVTTPAVTNQKTFTVTCDGGTANATTTKVIVNTIPVFNPF